MLETTHIDTAIKDAEKEYVVEGVLLDAKKFFHVYGGNILDKYTVKLYARAYQDLEEIYSYIANSLLEPDTALNMVDD